MQPFRGFPAILFLIFAVAKTATSAGRAQFGCQFEDDKYTMNVDKPTWASDPRTPMIFKDELELDKVINRVREIYKEYLNNTVRSDVDRILRFYSDFKNQNKSLGEFFNTYKLEFQPNEDAAGLVIGLIAKLKSADVMPDIEKHVYLVSVNMDVAFDHKAEYFKIANAMPQDYFHGYTAGAVKITVGSSRSGFILFNLELGTETPIVLMEDESPPHIGTYSGGERYRIEFKLKNGFLLSNIFTQEEIEKNGEIETVDVMEQQHLTYMEKPYCSFMQKAKANLLSPEHGILSRKASGKLSEYVQFRIIPTQVQQKSHEILFLVFEEKDRLPVRTEGRVLVDALQSKASNKSDEDAKQRDIVKNNADLVKMEGDDLLSKLQKLKQVVFDDEKLLSDIYQLEEKLWLDDDKKSCVDVKNAIQCLETMSGARKLIDHVMLL